MKVLRIKCIILCIILVLCISGCADKQQELSVDELISLGEKFLLDLNYEQAVVQFLKVIEIEPMNPRGYTGAAEAYMGLGETDSAMAILEKGAQAIPGNEEIQKLIDEIENNSNNLDELLSPSEIAEHEPWKLFDNPLLADEIKFAGIPFWDCSLEDILNYYPDGIYAYKDSEGRLRDLEGEIHEADEILDSIYFTSEISYYTIGSRRHVDFHGISEIRELSVGMAIDEALVVLGFSSIGTVFVKEEANGVFLDFFMDENGCRDTEILTNTNYGTPGPSDWILFSYYDAFNNKSMTFGVGIRNGYIQVFEIDYF